MRAYAAADFGSLADVAVVFVIQCTIGFAMFGTDGAEVEIVAGGNSGGTAFNLVRDGGCIEVDVVAGMQG